VTFEGESGLVVRDTNENVTDANVQATEGMSRCHAYNEEEKDVEI
jgi:hypothetical protein